MSNGAQLSSIYSRRGFLAAGGKAALLGLAAPTFLYGQADVAKELIFRTTHPRNGEPELSHLVQSWLTPTKHFYVRSHAPNPVLDPGEFRLQVEGLVRKSLVLSLDELLRFPVHSTTATLTCAGNRRAEFNTEGRVGGVQWGAGAIGNAQWDGVALADVLKKAELLDGARHVWFEGLDQIKYGNDVIPFGGSIPIEKAMTPSSNGVPGAMLVHKMNGQALTPDHGYPLRTVVPGYIGARSVKWLGKIVVSDRPSPNHYLATAYKVVKKTDPIDWIESGPIYRYPVNAAICTPSHNGRVSAGELALSGYVLPTGRQGSTPKAVLVSADEGASWAAAQMSGDTVDFCWRLWNATVKVTPQTRSVIVRAVDTSGGFMPQRVPWNAKGYLQNSWYRMPITVV